MISNKPKRKIEIIKEKLKAAKSNKRIGVSKNISVTRESLIAKSVFDASKKETYKTTLIKVSSIFDNYLYKLHRTTPNKTEFAYVYTPFEKRWKLGLDTLKYNSSPFSPIEDGIHDKPMKMKTFYEKAFSGSDVSVSMKGFESRLHNLRKKILADFANKYSEWPALGCLVLADVQLIGELKKIKTEIGKKDPFDDRIAKIKEMLP
ncbi:MAG: hypothetical protein V1824_02535 [archaeon]